MRCFHHPDTDAHDPKFRITNGRVHDNAERAERAQYLLDGLSRLDLTPEKPDDAPLEAISAVHTPEFLAFAESAWEDWQALPKPGPEVVPNAFAHQRNATYPESVVGRAGWHMGDTSAPIGEGTWRATRAAAACAVAAADAVRGGEPAAYALCRPPGHHSAADRVAGHCMLNVAAIAAERLRQDHERVAILDIDVHHGNGTQAIFYDRPDVFFASIHADPSVYYPFFVGYAHEVGTGAGEGYNLNLPMPRSTTDADWLVAIEDALARIADYAPGALVVSLGLDAHENDPLEGMKVTFAGFEGAGRRISDAGFPTVLIQEGGYLSPDLSYSLEAFLRGYMR